ncbi:hypothetical protein [Kordia jejudonensis]|uniref:hypothetical protein n=1 Tax=Kordia jejudonensis TaxID=1348245 RepID=UPI000629BE6E|nr:hypothetical protein [Kordia jejudonensis]
MSKFEIPKENWKSISIDSALFILNESKDYIDYTLKESEHITSRSFSLVLILISLLSAIVGYTYGKIVDSELANLIIVNCVFIITIVFLLIRLFMIVFPKKMIVKGRIPKELAQKHILITPKLTAQENYLMLIIQEIENSQHKINFNLKQNKSRRDRMKFVMYTLIILLPIYLVAAFFSI